LTAAAPLAANQPAPSQSFFKRLAAHPQAAYYLIIAAGGALTACGVIMVASAASVVSQVQTDDPYYFGKRQILFAVVGLAFAWLLSRLPPRHLRRLAWPALLLAVIFVTLTYTRFGVEVNGNRNWLRLGPSWTQFQPSEFAKLALIVWGARHLADKGRRLGDLREWLSYVAVSLVLIAGVGVHDFGSACVIAAMFIATLFLAGAPLRLIGALGLAGAVGGVGLVLAVRGSQLSRIVAWLHPSQYALTYNFQANHGLYALASGGWWGEGLGASRQKWGGLMVTGHTDYILAIIGEELGLAGSLTVIGLFILLCGAGLLAARRSDDVFKRLVVAGVACWFALQAIVNIAVVVRWLPGLGVTLPLVSYGGSSLLATLMALGIMAGCARADGPPRKTAAPAVARITSVFARRRP
jgi:cell division protein FtsW